MSFLEPNDNETILKNVGDLVIGWTIARTGQRLVDVAAKMLLNKVFQKLKEKVEERLQE